MCLVGIRSHARCITPASEAQLAYSLAPPYALLEDVIINIPLKVKSSCR
jgi:hypothetical protein